MQALAMAKVRARRRIIDSSSEATTRTPAARTIDDYDQWDTVCDTTTIPRMVDRDLNFHQSRNKMNIHNLNSNRYLWRLQLKDWFHTLLRLHAGVSVSVLLCLWTIIVAVFAALYWYEDNVHYQIVDCGLGITDTESISFSGAFAFSLETATTVGYGLPGTSTSFFQQGCSVIQVTIYFEMIWSMMFNAFLFSFFFSLLSKSEFRSTQIIFTDKLLVNVEGNEAYARLQCYDIDSCHPLVEAHARMYFLDHMLKMHPLRLMDPNDDLGGVLYPSVPADILHHIDHHSALWPPKLKPPFVESSHGMVLRSIDSYTGNRDDIICPVCGESYGTVARWKKHVEYSSMIEANEGYPPEKSHCGVVMPPETEAITLEDLQQHIERTCSEIIVVVEAIDPQLSGSFQSLQSYKGKDIVFGKDFEKCVSIGQDRGRNVFHVDMHRFHSTTTTCNTMKHVFSSIRSSSRTSNVGVEREDLLDTNHHDEGRHGNEQQHDDCEELLENGGEHPVRWSYDTFRRNWDDSIV